MIISRGSEGAAGAIEVNSAPVWDGTGVALACNLPDDAGPEGRVWVPAGVSHRIRIADPKYRSRLLAAIFDLEPDPDLDLVLLGSRVDSLGLRERYALRARVALLPASGGLLSGLNAWENIILPLGMRQPGRLARIAGDVHASLVELGGRPDEMLGKIPEEMTLLEKKVAGMARILLESPDLLLVENFSDGLDGTDRLRIPHFASVYQGRNPFGTFVQLEDVLPS